MIVGYARVSTDDQTLALQLDALQAAGCETVFRDTISGAKTERPGYRKALDHCSEWRHAGGLAPDRLGRSSPTSLNSFQTLEGRGWGSRVSPSRSIPPLLAGS
jgi:DNA invertase Pin-like site-specific DNA recombinase